MSPSLALRDSVSRCQRFACRVLLRIKFPKTFHTASPARAQLCAFSMPGASGSEQPSTESCAESSLRRGMATSSWNVTWPSSEEVAYSFAKLSSTQPEKGLKFDEFVHAAEKLHLNFTRAEMKRIFEEVDKDGDGYMLLSEFQDGATTSPFFRALVRAVSSPHYTFDIPDTFDYSKSTEHNYSVPLEDGFVGDFQDIRKRMDYSFHQNYSHERQLWQDKLIRRCVLDGGFKTWEQPFLVHTCGPMGAGKGYVLGWLSAKGILPLEHIAKIDPDHFKLSMPEWPLYIARGQPSMAGTLTHKESGYIAEVAQEVALRSRTSVWVDGSLRDADWYSQRFMDLRERYPEYKIVILIISASEERLRRRLLHRSLQTGRYVPDHIAKASQRLFASLPKIIPLVDFVARIHNDDEPQLQALEVVDKTGDWKKIAKFVK